MEIPHEILDKIWKRLKDCQLERKLEAKMEIQRPHGGLTVLLSTRSQSITFEVLPAFNALGELSWLCVGGSRDLQGCVDREKSKKGVADSHVVL